MNSQSETETVQLLTNNCGTDKPFSCHIRRIQGYSHCLHTHYHIVCEAEYPTKQLNIYPNTISKLVIQISKLMKNKKNVVKV